MSAKGDLISLMVFLSGGSRNFSRGGGPPLRLVFKGEGSTTVFGFLKGVPFSKLLIFTLFWQNFLTKGGWASYPRNPPLDPPMSLADCVYFFLFLFSLWCQLVLYPLKFNICLHTSKGRHSLLHFLFVIYKIFWRFVWFIGETLKVFSNFFFAFCRSAYCWNVTM
jgi:hypothetical protein